MRMKSLRDCEYLDTLGRTMTHHPSSLVPRPSEFKTSQGPHVLSRLTGPAWDACDELEPEDVATADGVNMILDTLAEAFQGE